KFRSTVEGNLNDRLIRTRIGMTTASHDQRSRSHHRQRRVHRHSGVRYQVGNGTEVSCCVKYAIFVFNIIFFFFGFTLVAVGTYCQIDKASMYSRFQQAGNMALDPTLILIVVGILTFFIGFCGCIGSLRENTVLLTIYATLLGIIFALQVVMLAIMYFYKGKVMEFVGTTLRDVIPSYRDDVDLQTFIDLVQTGMQCCGIKGPDDWDANLYFAKVADCASNPGGICSSPEANGVPYSCCVNPFRVDEDQNTIVNTACGYKTREMTSSHLIFQMGCLDVIDGWIKTNMMPFGVALIIVVCIQMIAICLAQNLKSDILAQKAKWMNS
ncbi:hypothetical protein PFISCL1PPCAC_15521, partial [Pristionchus fissidentatus]